MVKNKNCKRCGTVLGHKGLLNERREKVCAICWVEERRPVYEETAPRKKEEWEVLFFREGRAQAQHEYFFPDEKLGSLLDFLSVFGRRRR